jgi:hypothetical protein
MSRICDIRNVPRLHLRKTKKVVTLVAVEIQAWEPSPHGADA